jgi:glutamate synthase (ferredoxin)
VGRSDLLVAGERAKERNVLLSRIIENPYIDKPQNKVKYNDKKVYDFQLENTVDMKILMKKLGPALEKGQKKSIELDVVNTDRSVGTIFGSEITKRYGESLADDTYLVRCNGAGGQSFGAFIPKGLTLELVGDSNDYFGKGLSGGKLIVYPPCTVKFAHEDNVIVGNVALYGATSGKAFINGVAGERFAVRNSGATAVVEGVGDHGCEYMTGGKVVVLGSCGKNFAAGMSGGIAYVLDMENNLYRRLNKEMIEIEAITDKYEIGELKQLIVEHVNYTNSEIGKKILEKFDSYLPKFKKIIPRDYEKMMNTIVALEEKGLSRDKAAIEAFYKVKKSNK